MRLGGSPRPATALSEKATWNAPGNVQAPSSARPFCILRGRLTYKWLRRLRLGFLVPDNGARHATEVLMKAAALRSFLVMLFLVVTPAMAEQKLFFSCTNGRDPQTNAIVSDPHLILIVESEAKSFSVNEDSRDFDHLNDRKITVIAGAKLDQEPAATTKLIVEHFGGHLSLVITLDNCEGDHQNMQKGFCITSSLYDCFILWLER